MAQFASAHTVQQHQHGLEFLPPWYRVTSSPSFCHIFTTKKGKKKKKWKQGEVAALLFFFFFWNNKQPKAQRGNLKEKKNVEKHNDKPRLCGEPYLRRCICFEPHSLELFVGGGGGRGQFWRESPRVESLELHDSARTPAARASGRGVQVGWCFISVCLNNSASPVAFKAAYLTCLFTPRNNTERRYGGIFFFLRNMKSV